MHAILIDHLTEEIFVVTDKDGTLIKIERSMHQNHLVHHMDLDKQVSNHPVDSLTITASLLDLCACLIEQA